MDKFSLKKIIIESIVIIGISAVIGLTANAVSSSPLALFKSYVPPVTETKIDDDHLADHHFSEVDDVLLRELAENGQAVLLDARAPVEYEAAHIPGALNLPALQYRKAYKKLAPRLSGETIVIIYCSSPDCEDSIHVALKLEAEGYDRIMLYRGGFSDWFQKGLPVEKIK